MSDDKLWNDGYVDEDYARSGEFLSGYGAGDDDDDPPEGWISPSDIQHYQKRRCYGYPPEFRMLKFDPDTELRGMADYEASFQNHMHTYGALYRPEKA